MENKFYTGDYRTDSPEHRGWFVGTFMDDLRKTDLLEIKYVKGEISSHPKKRSRTLEVTIVFTGTLGGEVGGQKVSLKAGEYVVIPPGVENNLDEASPDYQGFTIKAPSDPSAKIVLGE
ncbi:MAG TPA: hypothetical protein PK263_01125 [bacterium]|nr:hypothetical protein [bacterium]